jgi:hypothetical protein
MLSTPGMYHMTNEFVEGLDATVVVEPVTHRRKHSTSVFKPLRYVCRRQNKRLERDLVHQHILFHDSSSSHFILLGYYRSTVGTYLPIVSSLGFR